jgi:hypothetical protein
MTDSLHEDLHAILRADLTVWEIPALKFLSSHKTQHLGKHQNSFAMHKCQITTAH